MTQITTEPLPFPACPEDASQASAPQGDPLAEVLHRGARQLLIQAVEAEVAQWVGDPRCHRRCRVHRRRKTKGRLIMPIHRI
jgi:hypothetical protein